MLYSNTSNEKGLLENDNARSSENIVIDTHASSSLLYSHNSNYNSTVSKATSKSRIKRTIAFHARKANPVSLATDVVTKRDDIYNNHRYTYTLDYLAQEHNSHEVVSKI